MSASTSPTSPRSPRPHATHGPLVSAGSLDGRAVEQLHSSQQPKGDSLHIDPAKLEQARRAFEKDDDVISSGNESEEVRESRKCCAGVCSKVTHFVSSFFKNALPALIAAGGAYALSGLVSVAGAASLVVLLVPRVAAWMNTPSKAASVEEKPNSEAEFEAV